MPNGEPRRRSCFLFYIYGFFLGLGCGVIAAILAFVGKKPASDHSKVLIVGACVLSVFTFIAQLVLSCRGEEKAGQRSATIVVGLVITALATVASIASSSNHKGIFFMQGTISTVFYLFTVIAFTINFFRDRKIKRQQGEAAQYRDLPVPVFPHLTLPNPSYQSNIDSDIDLTDAISLPDLPRIEGSVEYGYYDGEGRRDITQPGILPTIALPAYSEVPATSPHMMHVTNGNQDESPPTYLESTKDPQVPPPSYSEISFPLFNALETIRRENPESRRQTVIPPTYTP